MIALNRLSHSEIIVLAKYARTTNRGSASFAKTAHAILDDEAAICLYGLSKAQVACLCGYIAANYGVICYYYEHRNDDVANLAESAFELIPEPKKQTVIVNKKRRATIL